MVSKKESFYYDNIPFRENVKKVFNIHVNFNQGCKECGQKKDEIWYNVERIAKQQPSTDKYMF